MAVSAVSLISGAIVVALGFVSTSVRATTVVPPDFATLVNGSDCIVRVIVRSVHAEKRSGPPHDKIVTLVEADVLEVIAGSAPPTMTLQFLGGRVGDEQLRVSGMPEFTPGDEEVLFVQGNNGHSVCPLMHMMYGRYPIVRDADTGRALVLRHDGTALTSPAAVSSPLAEASRSRHVAQMGALELADFVRAIRAAISLQGGPGHAK